MKEKIQREPTAQNLASCFLDYVDAGVWGNLDYDEAEEEIAEGEITVPDMCRAIMKL